MKKRIPNIITCLNLLCGCFAIVFSFYGNLTMSAYLVGIAAVFDFLDGLAARLLHAYSETGKQLDSLADMVTFGVVPGCILFQMLSQSLITYGSGTEIHLLGFMGFLITVFSALRLAKFNTDTRQTTSFIGVPTPANTILIASFPLIVSHDAFELKNIIQHPFFLIAITLVMSYLLIAELPLFSLKFKNLRWSDNKIQYLFLLLSSALLPVFQFAAIPLIIFMYIILSIVNNRFIVRK